MAPDPKRQKTSTLAAPPALLALEAPGAAASGGLGTAEASGAAPALDMYPEPLSLELVAKGGGNFAQWAKDIVNYTDHNLPTFIAANKSKCNALKVAGQDLMTLTPLSISSANSGLTSFREVMRFDNMKASIASTGLYEAAGTVFMINPKPRASGGEFPTVPQVDAAMALWCEQTYVASHQQAHMRRFSFPVPLPAIMETEATMKKTGDNGVLFTSKLELSTGHAVVLAWYAATGAALHANDRQRALKLFEAALSVPIRIRKVPSPDIIIMDSLVFSESVRGTAAASGADSFWTFTQKVSQLSIAADDQATQKALHSKIGSSGVTFLGKPLSMEAVKAFCVLRPLVVASGAAYIRAETVVPEIKGMTVLMRLGQIAAKRRPSGASQAFAYLLDSLRVMRIAGDLPPDGTTVRDLCGSDAKPALAHLLLKKEDFVEYLWHETGIRDSSLQSTLSMFRNLDSLLAHFGPDLVTSYFNPGGASGAGTSLAECLSTAVANFRERLDAPKATTCMDILWGTWTDTYDETFVALCVEDAKPSGGGSFSWHRYLLENSNELCTSYAAFVAAFTAGPITSGTELNAVGDSELVDEAEQAQKDKLQREILAARRKIVNFTALEATGAAPGAEFDKLQLTRAWESLNNGHKFGASAANTRVLLMSCELFPPCIALHGAKHSLSQPITAKKTQH